jgi:hypothetical protein
VSLTITKIEVGDARTTVDTAALTIPSFAFKTEVVAITLLDSIHQPELFSTSGEAEYEITSTGADVSSLEKLYVKALKLCVYKAFESIDEFLGKQQK